MKRFLMFLAMIICLSGVNMTAFATDNYVTVMVAGESVRFDQAPVIVNGRMLVPIRAVCEKIGATVSWNENTKTASVTKDNLTLSLTIGDPIMKVSDGTFTYLDAPPLIYGGRTLLPIRAVVEKFGYEVQWNEETKIVNIEQPGTIIFPNLANTQKSFISNTANISSVQQFMYKNEGLAYAYEQDGSLIITTPSSRISFAIKYPKLGDVISDDDGNFYVVWGKDNETADASIETVFISKYSPDGQHIDTTGFVGKSTPWGDSDSAKTKVPFRSGNCVSVIADDILVNYHSKQRYDGHQSDSVIAVRINDMSPYTLPNDTYSGHSFNQSLIYSKITSDFLFASHGDAYARGFRINDASGKYGNAKEILFHFYLEANANYDMYKVNKTFAQLGGLAETSEGVALVGASAKSIGEAAKLEKQNLFIQVFDPRASGVSKSMFIGGTTRSGATSFDIKDNNNSPLTQVSDYGVRWLTDYTDTDVVAPQVVEANDRIVILWSTKDDSFYMTLSPSGDILTPATSLGGLPLNSYERPVYYNGAVYWAGVKDGKLKICSINI